jgi:1-acyl-sn-glycerol-3-phosphate acyltransferase
MSKASYKAHRLHVAWIQFLTAIFTLWACIRIFYTVYVGPNKQARLDKILRNWGHHLLDPTGLKLKINNPYLEAFDPTKRIILMVNHTSLYDIPISYLAVPGSIRMLAKKELFKIPIFGQAMHLSGMVSVDRQNREQAKKDLAAAKKALETGTVLWVAPEGTRSRDGKLHRFKKGGFHVAIQTQATIIPVGIKGVNKVLPSNSYDLVMNGEVEVSVGEPIDASDYTLSNKDQLIDKVYNSIASLIEE